MITINVDVIFQNWMGRLPDFDFDVLGSGVIPCHFDLANFQQSSKNTDFCYKHKISAVVLDYHALFFKKISLFLFQFLQRLFVFYY